MRIVYAAAVALALAACSEREPEVPYIPTPQPVVDAMLELGEIEDGDVLYDLGSGDGRIPITAAREYGIRAVGIEIDPRLVSVSNANARAAGVEDLVQFVQADLFSADLREASVVTLYLNESLNERLQPKLQEELKPGSRIVSHSYQMSGWTPDAQRVVGGATLLRWTLPAESGAASEE